MAEGQLTLQARVGLRGTGSYLMSALLSTQQLFRRRAAKLPNLGEGAAAPHPLLSRLSGVEQLARVCEALQPFQWR